MIKMLTIQCKMQEDHTTACAQDTYPLTAEEAKVKSLSVSILKLFPHSSKTCKTKTIIKHFLMRKALVPLTTGYCQSTVTCKTRLSCLDFASWLSHQLKALEGSSSAKIYVKFLMDWNTAHKLQLHCTLKAKFLHNFSQYLRPHWSVSPLFQKVVSEVHPNTGNCK